MDASSSPGIPSHGNPHQYELADVEGTDELNRYLRLAQFIKVDYLTAEVRMYP